MKFVSLFTGIGGLDLGLERAGWECVAQVEDDPWCIRILEKHWPDTPRWKDIHDLSPTDLPDTDAIVGGFPCQPVSLAGARLAQDDERWLWPEFLRVVRHVRPRIVLVENVPGLASAGMGDVLGDLAACGYDAEWQSIPAAAVGAPHLRWRLFVIAYPNKQQHPSRASTKQREAPAVLPTDRDGERLEERGKRHGQPQQPRQQTPLGNDANGFCENVADREVQPLGSGFRQDGPIGQRRRRPGDGGGAGENWAIEPDVGRVADGVPNRVDRLRGLGNAVVPQVAEWVGRIVLDAANPPARRKMG